MKATFCRRDLLRFSLLGGASLGLGCLSLVPALVSGHALDSAGVVVETATGKVRGYRTRHVCAFKGIPYGASIAGENRFRPAKLPTSWTGVRDARSYGPMAVQPEDPTLVAVKSGTVLGMQLGALTKGLFRDPPTPSSEECLVLNVWSPAIGGRTRRPVIVWLHGGAFRTGSAEGDWTDGTNLAAEHDLVVVSLNHRLNIFGYLHLADIGGPEFADSNNVGMLDIVAALKWVRDNVANFGGEPNNVTIFGQSGGGAKVDVLMAMPSAAGLFHKAINMSGPGERMLSREEAERTATQVLDFLGISRREVRKLREVPPSLILSAVAAVHNDAMWKNGRWFHNFSPVIDGMTLPENPFDPNAPTVSRDVPMIFGNCNDEYRIGTLFLEPLTFDPFDQRGVQAKLLATGITSEQASDLVQAYRATRPAASATDIYSAIISDMRFRFDGIKMAERKALLGRAPAYMYLLGWASPAFGGKFGSSHAFDIPFAFDNLDGAQGLVGQSPDARDRHLARQMSSAFAAYARHGDPNHKDLPLWKPYDARERSTMIFDRTCTLVDDPRSDDRLALEQLRSSG